MDGEPIKLVGFERLEVIAPAGEHTYQFRYQPWDVFLGLALSLIGVILSIYIWRTNPGSNMETKETYLDPYAQIPGSG